MKLFLPSSDKILSNLKKEIEGKDNKNLTLQLRSHEIEQLIEKTALKQMDIN